MSKMADATNEPNKGLVVASFGRQVIVEDEFRKRYKCRMKGRALHPVCGDIVRWTPLDNERVKGVVNSIDKRTNSLCRPNRRGGEEIVAANLHQLLVVFCSQPPADPFLVDRYIASAEHVQLRCVLINNKIDLPNTESLAWLDELEQLGYPVISTSAESGAGLDQLRAICTLGNNILVGQSGVGKSSLLNALIPGIDQQTGAISDSGKFGRHTTSASFLYHLDNEPETGGALIDSPGVRDFAPPPLDEEQVPNGYIEILAAAQDCRFSNCRHEHEPACAVKKQVENGIISARRYASYGKLMQLMRALKASAGH